MTNPYLETHFASLIQQKKIHSASYCIAKGGTIVSCNAIGDMDLGHGNRKAVRTDTLFETQSITKWITAAAILILMERGALSLTDRAGYYIREFNQHPFSQISIMHLLTHTSGLVPLDDAFPERDLDWEALVDTQDVANSWIPAVLKLGLFYEPGSRWEYSMIGFCVLGEIIARITGQRAEDFIRTEILLPCHMTETHWKREITPEWAQRYQVRTERHRQQYAQSQLLGAKAWIDYCAGWKEIPETAGGLMSTLQDLIRFGILLSEGGCYGGTQLLQENSIRFFEKNQLMPGMRDFCWDHGGRRIAYGAGCVTCDCSFDQALRVGEHTIYHEGAGACVLMANRKKQLAAVWDTPFWNEDEWCTEAITDTANIIWNTFL